MNIFAELPVDISKMIYRTALKIKNDEKMMRMRVFDAIKIVAHDLRRTKNVSNPIFEEYNIKMIVDDAMEIADDGDAQFKFAILRRTGTIDACGTKIIIKYRRCHALVKNKNYVGHRKISYREHIKIYRADGRSSKMLKKINIDLAIDRPDIRARDVYGLIKKIAHDDEMALNERMSAMIS